MTASACWSARDLRQGRDADAHPAARAAAIKITTAHYLTPSQRDINLRGIDPDVTVIENRDARFGDVSKDAQLQAAIALLEKKIATTTKS